MHSSQFGITFTDSRGPVNSDGPIHCIRSLNRMVRYSVMPVCELLFLFCVQFSNHAPDMSIERVSFPILFRGFYSFVFRCIFPFLSEIVLFMVFCHMPCLSADEAFSFFH